MSLKSNFIYNSILTVSTYLFPLLVYPYISRTLGLSNIGIVNFVDNIINYFLCISMMGIATVGVREIAAAREDKVQLSRTYISLLSLTAITTLVAIVALWIAMYTIPKLTPYQDLLYVGIVKLAFNMFLVEWFFAGMENFRYITIRSLIIKFFYVGSIFLFVREASDYKVYFVITVASVMVNAIVNIIYSRNLVTYSFRMIDMRPFVRTFIVMGVYVLLINVYSSLNTVWLGFVTDTEEVGFFTTATKLHAIIMAVLASFTNILFPRMSHLLAENKEKEFWEKIRIAFDAVCMFAFPTIVFMMVAGPEVLHIFVGDGFEGAYLPFRIITPLVLIIGIEQIIVIQILMTMHKDNTVLKNCFYGALMSLIANVILTEKMGAPGSAVVWVIAECTILCLSLVAVYKEYKYIPPYQRIFSYCLSYLPLLLLSIFIYYHQTNVYVTLVILFVLTCVYAALNETFVLKNRVVRQTLLSIRSRF